MIDARQGMDTCTAPPMQRLVARFLDGGHADAHLAGLRTEYRQRKIALQKALAGRARRARRALDRPGGRLLPVARARRGDRHRGPFPLALEEGVAYIPGPAFSIGGRFANALRLAFSAEPPDRAREGVRRLARAIHRLPSA